MEWKASHILVKEKGLADQLRDRLKSGANFGDLAGEFSICPSKSRGGAILAGLVLGKWSKPLRML